MTEPAHTMWNAPVFSAKGELRAAIAAGVLLAAGFVLHTLLHAPYGQVPTWTSLAIGMVYGGRAALDALSRYRLDIDSLMVVGAALAAAIGHPSEGALLLFLFVLSGALEDLAMQRTTREVEALHKLMPADAMVLRNGEWVMADAGTLTPGEIVKVRPGERVPADACVTSGESSFDQSAITGESLPRTVRPGDDLFAGTINADDPIEARVLRPVRESSLQKILDLVTTAREQREPVQRAIDRLEQPYTVAVFAVSLAVLLVWWKVFGVALVPDPAHGPPEAGAVYTAITLLIVASPCALIIATPTATLAAIARGARDGVLFKGGQSIERLAGAGSVCFDKTGTLTFGRPRLTEVHPVAWSDPTQLLAIAAALEADSTHPIAVAVLEAAAQRGIVPAIVTNVNHTTAQGIAGEHDGRAVRLGRYAFVEPLIPQCFRARVRDVLGAVQGRGHVAVVVARDGTPNAPCDAESGAGEVAVLIMADQVRPGAITLVRELHALGVRPVRMLTGDNKATAARIAESLGLDAVDAELLPEDKLRIVAEMKAGGESKTVRRTHGGVAFIGDGVNDAPALAAADVALGIGTIGTAAALESADIVLLSDNLGTVPWALALARRARATVTRNLTLALSIIALMAVATLIGSRTGHPVPLSIGVLAHEGGTLLVVLNSLLLLWLRGPARDASADDPSPKPGSASTRSEPVKSEISSGIAR